MKARTYIYALYDSRDCSEAIYVGRTADPGKRFTAHTAKREPITKQWVADVLRHGGEVRMVILEGCPEVQGPDHEARWICSIQPALNINGKRRVELLPNFSGYGPVVYWPEKNRYFQSLKQARTFFDVSYPALAKAMSTSAPIYSRSLRRQITLEHAALSGA